MTILSVCQEASLYLGIPRPDRVFGSDEQEHMELAEVANEMGARIARAAEWQALTRLHTLTGDGTTTDFDLPTDFDRFPKGGEMRSNTWAGMKLRHVIDHDEWLEAQIVPLAVNPPIWTVLSGQTSFNPALTNGEIVKFYYISSLFAQSEGGDNQASFLADDDVFRLNERTLKLSIIAQWRANKGMDIEPHATVAGQALAEDIARDKGPREIVIGRQTMPRGVTVAYPFTLG